MKRQRRVLAIDLGASSGRAMLGIYDGESIRLEEIHRFSNDPVMIHQTMYWDLLRLFYEIKQGMVKAKHLGGFDSIAVDTWGVDFGLLDRDGYLLENPVHYRDQRTRGMLSALSDLISSDELYRITGNQIMEINTAFQLLSLIRKRPALIERADTLLMIPDLLHYFLTGIRVTEFSIASTAQLMDVEQGIWSRRIIDALGVPERLFTKIIPCATVVGPLSRELCEELGVEPADVIAAAGHDTQCALISVPSEEEDFIFISCGTWSLLGTELRAPLVNEKSRAYHLTNEGGFEKTSFLKNIIGLWLVQECRRQWIREGEEYDFGTLEAMAAQSEAFCCYIDPDAPEFVSAGNLPERIRGYCRKTGQKVPETKGQIIRCINESLALKYRGVIDQIADCTEKSYDKIHIVGGGTQSRMLCQMTANACGRPVLAGPVEATVLGNMALQLIATGALENSKEARAMISNTSEIQRYHPQEAVQWSQAYQQFKEVTGC